MSAIRELTRLSPNYRKVAALLQSKGRYGDTLLAHINEREAQMLKDAGGAGTINPDTGLLEFYDPYMDAENMPGNENFTPAETFAVSDTTPQDFSFAAPQQFDYGAFYNQYTPPAQPAPEMPQIEIPTMGPTPMAPVETRAIPPDIQRPGLSPEGKQMLTQLGVAGLQTLPAILAARRAQDTGRQSTQQQQQIAQPYQQMGRQLQAQAQAGQLTPQGQQALQAARAQMAQGLQRSGGLGAQQAAIQLQQFRQNLLQQQMDYGLKLSGIGDQIALGAIRSGMQADQYANQLTMQFMSNLFRNVLPPQQAGQPAPAPQPRPPGG